MSVRQNSLTSIALSSNGSATGVATGEKEGKGVRVVHGADSAVNPGRTGGIVTGIFYETSAFLLAVSLTSVSVGTSELSAVPSKNLPYVLLRMASISHVLSGILGIWISIRVLISHVFHGGLTRIVFWLQVILGVFSLLISDVILPILTIIVMKASFSAVHVFSVEQSQLLLGLSSAIKLSSHWCLFGSQLQLIYRLLSTYLDVSIPCTINNSTLRKRRRKTQRRAIFWLMNLSMVGLFTILASLMILMGIGPSSASLPMEAIASLNLGIYPLVSVFAGFSMLIWGIAGTFIMLNNEDGSISNLISIFVSTSPILYIIVLLNNSLLQNSGRKDAAFSSSLAAANAGISFVLVHSGPFFMQKLAAEADKSEDPLNLLPKVTRNSSDTIPVDLA